MKDFVFLYTILGFIMLMSLYFIPIDDKFQQALIFALGIGFFVVALGYSWKGEKVSEKSAQ